MCQEQNLNIIPFHEAFNKYIKGQTVKNAVSYYPYASDKPADEKYYGDGMEFENGYKYISFGGGCSGEDCNVTFIVNDKNKLVASVNW